MYLISIYFDEKTNERLQSYVKLIAKYTGNNVMVDGSVPPHITISAFHSYNEETALEIFRSVKRNLAGGKVHFVSIGSFLPQVLYVTPVLNEYLHRISTSIYKEVTQYADVVVGERTRPFGWLPHVTVGRELSEEQLQKAFGIMQKQFAPFKGEVIRIGLARTNPYTDIETYVLK